ncbi:MAG: hypothetical protein M3133_10240 [Actinomycetota bacterium]|nr:hypothetical protein [Actinomycetota bacterium]
MAGVESLDTLLIATLIRHGPLSDEDLWREAPLEQVGRAELSGWLESAERRNLVSREDGPGGLPVWEVTERGRESLEE